MGVRISALTETTTMADAYTLPTDTTGGTRRISWANIKTAIFGAINGLTSKSTPVGTDVIVIGDSAASFAGKKTTLAEAGIIKTYITQQATNTRVTGSGPSSLGNYRSYLRAAGVRTYSETNGAPSTTPSTSNGYRLYAPANSANADASGEPSRYEIYIGTGKEPVIEFYSGTGRTGVVYTRPFTRVAGGDVNGGVQTHYDPVSGVASIILPVYQTGDFYTGLDSSGTPITSDIYFDIKC